MSTCWGALFVCARVDSVLRLLSPETEKKQPERDGPHPAPEGGITDVVHLHPGCSRVRRRKEDGGHGASSVESLLTPICIYLKVVYVICALCCLRDLNERMFTRMEPSTRAPLQVPCTPHGCPRTVVYCHWLTFQFLWWPVRSSRAVFASHVTSTLMSYCNI